MREIFEFYLKRGEAVFASNLENSERESIDSNSFRSQFPGLTVLGTGNPIRLDEASKPISHYYHDIARAAIAGDYRQISEFDGPFLVAAIDTANRKLYVVRDKFGLRSVYFSINDEEIQVSENVSSIKGSGLRDGALAEWMHYGAPLSPHTFFSDVNVVSAGSFIVVDFDQWGIVQKNYFLPESLVSIDRYKNYRKYTSNQAEAEFDEIFDNSLKQAVQGHKRVSLLLSGGVDSSLLAAYARKHVAVDAVTVDIYGEKAETEVHFAKAVAKKLDVELKVVRFGRTEFLENICQTIAETCSPIIIENAVALNFVARMGHLKNNQLIVDGEGADALMGGSTSLFKYSYSLLHLERALGINASFSRSVMESLRKYFSKLGLQTSSTLDKAGLDVGLGARNIEVQALTNRLLSAFSHIECREEREISALMTREFYDYLVPLMIRIDKMSAHVNSNTVLPYLLQPVFDFLLNLSSDHRFGVRGLKRKPVTKFLLKSVLTKEIGEELVYRPKVGFGIPAHLWMKLPEQWRNDLWIAGHYKMSNGLMASWIDDCRTRDKLFIISMEIWARIFIRKIPLAQVCDEWITGQNDI